VELYGPCLVLRQVPERERSLEFEMTKHIAPLPDPDGSLLLRELNHRVNNELTSTIYTISAKAGVNEPGNRNGPPVSRQIVE
jgi:hypothetical protein